MSAARTRLRASLATGAVVVACALAAPLHAQWTTEGAAVVGRMEHRVDIGYGVAASTGTVVGISGRALAWDLLELDIDVLGGRLAGDSTGGIDRRVGEVGARASVFALPWLAFYGTGSMRGYESVTARQRWTTLGAGAEARLALADGRVRGTVRTALLPYVRASGLPAPDLGITSGAGLQVTAGRIVTELDYVVERYVSPAGSAGDGRHEQLSHLLLRVGARW